MSTEFFSSVSVEELKTVLHNKLFRNILNTMPNGVHVLTALRNQQNEITDFVCEFANGAAENYFGKKITGKKFSSFFNNQNRFFFFQKLINVVTSEVTEDFIHHHTQDLEDKWFQYTINKFGDGVMVTQEDITEGKRAEQEMLRMKDELMKKSVDEQLKRITESTPILLTKISKDLRYIFVNKATADFLGLPAEEIVGKSIVDILGRVAFEKISPYIERVLRGERVEYYDEISYSHSGQHSMHVIYIPSFDADNKVEGWYATITDVTEQKATEEVLRNSEERLKQSNISLELQVTEGAEELITQHALVKQAEAIAQAGSWEYNIKTRELTWSDGMYKLFEIEKEEALHPSIYLEKAIKEDHDIAKKIAGYIQKTFLPFEEDLRVNINGKTKSIKIKATVNTDKTGKPSKVIGIDVDVTAAKETNEKINELNEALSARNRELQSLNSELKTFTNLAGSDYKETLKHLYTLFEFIITSDARNLSNAGKANIRRAQSAIQKMKLLTDDIVAYSEVQTKASGKQRVKFLDIYLAAMQKLEGKIAENNALIDFPDKMKIIEGYPDLLSKLFYQIIDNSIKFRRDDLAPVIKIRVSLVPGMRINHSDADPTIRYTVISFTDNGIGINTSEKEKIFTMFYKGEEKRRGSGIGLAICKKIMHIHKGFINAEPTPENKGTTFNCYFPQSKMIFFN